MSDNTGASVDPADPAKKTSEIAGPSADDATVSMDMMSENCMWNDTEFKLGERINTEGKIYECSFGRWIEVDD